jgi:class 3 adenylate cyclase
MSFLMEGKVDVDEKCVGGQFDHICEKRGIEKIKTIGDAYMAAGGLPAPNTTHKMWQKLP